MSKNSKPSRRNSRPETILVTGGCGFIGTNLVKYLSEKGYQVRILDNLSTSSRIWITDREFPIVSSQQTQIALDSGVLTLDLMVGDIRDRAVVEEAVKGMEAVVHLAAHTSVVDSLENTDEVFDVNAKGTLNLLEACRKNGADKFIFASSNAVVGKQTPPIDETKVPQSLSPYGASKLAGEALCSAYYHSFGLKTISLRFANCYGPYCDYKSSVISRFMRWTKEGKPLIIYGDGNQTRDFVHVDDVCQAIYLSLTTQDSRPSTPDFYGEVFQIAAGVETSINELATLAREIIGRDVQAIHEAERKGEIRRNYSNISKAKSLLGFQPKIKLKEGLKELWRSYSTGISKELQ